MATQKKGLDETAIKTRLGLILQGVLREALTQAGFKFEENHQYDPTCEKPDFLIPDATNPKFVIEVHQTEARNSFQMKVLRAFTAVTEAKVFYGKDIISVNVLFGDPNKELPASNIKALYSFFDVNVVPGYEVSSPETIKDIESEALKLASEQEFDSKDATETLVKTHKNGISELTYILQNILNPNQSINLIVKPLWDLEKERTTALVEAVNVGDSTYYKRSILNAVSFTQEELDQVRHNLEPLQCSRNCSEEIKKKLVAFKVAKKRNSIKKEIDITEIDSKLIDFMQDSSAMSLVHVARERLKDIEEMRWFFEDIRDAQRRLEMAQKFFEVLEGGSSAITDSIRDNLIFDNHLGVNHHRRCWMADLIARYSGVSHNQFNKYLSANGFDPQNLGNPFNQITYKSKRFMSNTVTHDTYLRGVKACIDYFLENPDLKRAPDAVNLANRLLELRLDGVVKLQKFNPLYLVAEDLFIKLELKFKYLGIKSIIADLAGSASATASFKLYRVTKDKKTVLVNAIAVTDHHGDDKSKEWGARRRSTLYRLINGEICPSEYQDALFVVDGEWEFKDINRLYKSGWNHIIRLHNLEAKLREIFDIPDPAVE